MPGESGAVSGLWRRAAEAYRNLSFSMFDTELMDARGVMRHS